jgi:hypothetical protein
MQKKITNLTGCQDKGASWHSPGSRGIQHAGVCSKPLKHMIWKIAGFVSWVFQIARYVLFGYLFDTGRRNETPEKMHCRAA